ncbi:hypothetical protein GUJ93_ZPchr0001g29848 [Zizania palustris]|uniref:Uncharacterized protein n=1 Tax=Zizania palustris TaxID=103762 RepID=A0A8J5UZR5_ZIZPA|nr:hypothetical protein GUJ93_ZPchr0001g29848 [Zizania palustris]
MSSMWSMSSQNVQLEGACDPHHMELKMVPQFPVALTSGMEKTRFFSPYTSRSESRKTIMHTVSRVRLAGPAAVGP